ncbi:MAG: Crp/Fnr family transcriptional regulator [Anaerolineales bacterium]|nr:Crp/Fnr family transcriptional regulator [Anaerolineales bacterium]
MSVTYDKLAAISLFQDMPQETLAALAGHCRLINLSAGAVLFHQGDTSHTLYVIEAGELHLVREYEDGEKVLLAVMHQHDVVGDLSMISNLPRTASGVAARDTILIALDRDIFFEYLGQYPTIAVQALVQLSSRLRQMTLTLRELAATDAPARLASLILFLAEENGRIKTGLISTNFRFRRIARSVGVEVEWLQTQLRQWSDEGYIGIDGRRFLLHDPSHLIDIAGWT